MVKIPKSILKSELKKKAFLWGKLKELSDQKNIPITLKYQRSNSNDILDEINRLESIEKITILRKKPTRVKQTTDRYARGKMWDTVKELSNKLKEKGRQGTKLRFRESSNKELSKEINRLSKKLECPDGMIEFMKNPIVGCQIEVLSPEMFDEMMEYYEPNDNFILTLEYGNDYYVIKGNISRFFDILEAIEQNEYKGQTNSDEALWNYLRDWIAGNTRGDITLVWREKQRERPQGAYFKYYHNLDRVDLTRYGIYNNTLEADYKINCLEMALLNSGISKDSFNKLKTLIKTRNVPQKDLRFISEELNITIELQKHTKDISKKTIYGNNDSFIVKIGLIDEHYFLIEKTEYTSYSIKNYEEVKDIPNFKSILRKDRNKYRFTNKIEDKISSYDLIRYLFLNKETLITKITLDNIKSNNNYNSKLFEYEELPEIKEDEYKLVEKTELKKPLCFSYSEKITIKEDGKDKIINILKYEPYEILYFDTETRTDDKTHKVFMICSETRNNLKSYFVGENCILLWLKSLKKNYQCYAHNLRYDFSFVIKYLKNISGMIKTGNQIKAISGEFYNKDTDKTIKLYFKDSLSLINKKLSNFKDIFKLKTHKEVIPYGAYNKNTVDKPFMKIDIAMSFLKSEKDKKLFIENIDNWGLRYKEIYFNHIKYCKIYCEMDVTILKQGYEIFRGWMYEITGLELDNIISNPQLANLFGIKQNVFEGCYKISGVPRDFIQRCVVGGRCMTRRNKKFEIDTDTDDFDAVALYTSGMIRLDGFLKGLPKLWNPNVDLSKVDGYFLEIEVIDIPIKRDFPLLSRKNDKGIRIFDNDIRGRGVYVDKISLEDAIKYQDIKYNIIRGYYYDEGRNTNLKECMEFLFNERLKKKSEGNPIETCYKELMNSFYGKLIMKPIEHKYNFVLGEENLFKHISYHFNQIMNPVNKISDKLFLVKEEKSVLSHFSMPHCGVEVLSMSKRIMNEVMTLAEDNNIPIYYQDTDSMHLDARKIYGDKKSGADYLRELYNEKYKRELIGKYTGQFHCDFNDKKFDEVKEKMVKAIIKPVSVSSVYLGKKAYYDKIMTAYEKDEKDEPIIEFEDHIRLKGIPESCIIDYCNEKKISVEDLYHKLYKGDEVEFDLLKNCKFQFTNNFTIENRMSFIRNIKFA